MPPKKRAPQSKQSAKKDIIEPDALTLRSGRIVRPSAPPKEASVKTGSTANTPHLPVVSERSRNSSDSLQYEIPSRDIKGTSINMEDDLPVDASIKAQPSKSSSKDFTLQLSKTSGGVKSNNTFTDRGRNVPSSALVPNISGQSHETMSLEKNPDAGGHNHPDLTKPLDDLADTSSSKEIPSADDMFVLSKRLLTLMDRNQHDLLKSSEGNPSPSDTIPESGNPYGDLFSYIENHTPDKKGKGNQAEDDVETKRIPVFSNDDLELFESLMTDFSDSTLLGFEQDDDVMVKHVKYIMGTYLKQYKSPLIYPDTINALSFFLSFMKGEFAKDHGRVVFVFDGQCCLLKFDETLEGERYINRMLSEQKIGVFAHPTRGFWYSNLLLEKNEHDSRYPKLSNIVGVSVMESAWGGYFADCDLVLYGRVHRLNNLLFDTGCLACGVLLTDNDFVLHGFPNGRTQTFRGAGGEINQLRVVEARSVEIANSGMPVTWVKVGYLATSGNATRCLGLSALQNLSVLLSGGRVYVQRSCPTVYMEWWDGEMRRNGEGVRNGLLSNIIRSY